MKVLHVCETIKGGVATYLNTFEALCGDEIESCFIVPDDHADQLEDGLKRITFPRPKRGLAPLISLAKLVRREIAAEKPDVVFFHSSFTMPIMVSLRMRRTPGLFVYCPHSWARARYTESPRKAQITSAIEGRLVGYADLVLNISHNDNVLADTLGYRGTHTVVENALADVPQDALPSPMAATKDKINVLFVGRFDRQKGLDVLLSAFNIAVQTNPELHLHVVGASVQETPNDLPTTGDNVTFHSWVPADQINAYYAHADLVAITSRWEGLPMVLIEALRMGSPVLLSNSSGMGQLIVDGETGFVVSPTTDDVARVLGTVDAQTLQSMRPAARQYYQDRYSGARFRRETLAALRGGLQAAKAKGQHR